VSSEVQTWLWNAKKKAEVGPPGKRTPRPGEKVEVLVLPALRRPRVAEREHPGAVGLDRALQHLAQPVVELIGVTARVAPFPC
jgi:hypothetical protein